MTLTAESQKTIDAYLAALRRQLRDLMDEDARDIVEEIRAHILDKIAGDAPADSVSSTLVALGTPEELAARYRTEELLNRARMARSPKYILRSLLRWTVITIAGIVVFLISVVGYCLGGFLFIIGALKLTNPHKTGVWWTLTSHDSSFGWQSGGPNGGHDVLGWWLLPIGLLGGAALLFLTFRFGLWSIRRFWRPRAWR